MSEATATTNSRLVRKLLWVILGSFLFCFSLVPLYDIACEKLFGVRLSSDAAVASELSTEVDTSRWVTVQFLTTVNGTLPWEFQPKVGSLRVHPGQLTEVWFVASNTSDQPLVGQAVPSLVPNEASLFFNKTECFCFTEQLLKPRETRDMPVRFVVDPRLPADVDTLTLSYTFFLNDIATRRVAEAAAANGPSKT